MTTLLLDVGNSRVKWAMSDGKTLREGGSASHGGDPASALLQAALPPANAVWICHVMGPDHESTIAAAIRRRFGYTAHVARTAAQFDGLQVAYEDPQRLGVDRWLCMLALWKRSRSASCVVSAGTALTFDAVDASGRHLGGVIAPGLTAMQSAVLGTTRFAVDAVSEHYDDALGRDTESCVRQGALHAAAGLIERLGARHEGMRAITGGDAERLLPLLSGPWQLQPQLVLEGLRVLAADG